jgi:hypothetical protein
MDLLTYFKKKNLTFLIVLIREKHQISMQNNSTLFIGGQNFPGLAAA